MRRALAALMLLAAPVQAAPRIEERSIADLGAMMAAGTSSREITHAALRRIAAMDRRGPALHAVIAINPEALAQAAASDKRRRAGNLIGPLDGVPILVKDNIETADPVATTAGSLVLAANVTHRDAPVVAALRRAGAVILGKTNLSEWANIRSNHSVSGWSATGGLVRNPYVLDRTACGSSSGSGAAVAASFAPAALGTETDGSIICPSSMNGLVGLKPTVGLVSRTHVVPISHSQDTPGPMARSVQDVALLLTAIAGSDPADPATIETDQRRTDYAAGLPAASLRATRIAVLRPKMRAELAARFDAALAVLRAGGAELVEVTAPERDGLGEDETLVLQTELKADIATYLATTPPAVKARTLDDLIAFNRAEVEREMPWFGQETFEAAARTKGLDDPAYKAARATSQRRAAAAIDGMLKQARATILIQPSIGPAWPSDPVHGDQYDGPSASQLPAIAGYPHLTVPMGLVRGLPVGLSFIGPAWSEPALLAAGYAYERASRARVAPRYLPRLLP